MAMRKIKISLKNQARSRMLRNQLSSLVLYGEIQTTSPKAKFLKGEADRFVSKLGSLSQLEKSKLCNKMLYGPAIKKAQDEKYKSVSIYRVSKRFGDNADVSKVVLSIQDHDKEKKQNKPEQKQEIPKDKK